MHSLLLDLRFAWRVLLRNQSFTAIAVLTLALGIGSNAAIFTLLRSIVTRPLPYPESENVVRLWESFRNPSGHVSWGSVSLPNARDWREMNHVFASLGAFTGSGGVHLTGSGEPIRVGAVRVEPEVFDVLGVKPAMGRTFLPDENVPGRDRVVILSDALWRSRFAADPAIIGKTTGINGADFAVVGVMPPDFQFPPRSNAALWTPLAIAPSFIGWEGRGTHWLEVVARLKPGVSLTAARADMNEVAKRMAATYGEEQVRGVVVRTLHEATFGKTAGLLLALWGAVAFVLLIACANVASLMLARTTERRRELAVRIALGAGRWQIARLVMMESLLLAAAGGVAGMVAAPWTLDFLMSLHGNPLGREDGIQIDVGIFLFCAAASALTAIVSGLAPALMAGRTDLQTSLKEGGEVARGTLRWRRSTWVVAETALALALLVGAGVVVQSIRGVTVLNLGFDPHNVLTMRIDLPSTKYAQPERQIEFYDRLLAKVESLPGVRAAGIINVVPVQSCWNNGNFSVKERPVPPQQAPLIEHRQVSPGFFPALGIPVHSGRHLSVQDGRGAMKTAVLNRSATLEFWQGEEPLGQQISLGTRIPDDNWKTVVGIVGDVSCAGPHVPPRPVMYEPYWQFPLPNMSLVVRSALPPERLVPVIRRVVLEIDPDQPIYLVKTMDEVLEDWIAPVQFVSIVVSVFTGIAMALAAVGIFGVLSYLVSRSTHEIGLRMALGAGRETILRHVLKKGLAQVVVGIAAGIPLALAGAGVLNNLVEGVRPPDPWTLLIAVGVMLAAGLAASYIPAVRAANVHPMDALRNE